MITLKKYKVPTENISDKLSETFDILFYFEECKNVHEDRTSQQKNKKIKEKEAKIPTHFVSHLSVSYLYLWMEIASFYIHIYILYHFYKVCNIGNKRHIIYISLCVCVRIYNIESIYVSDAVTS